jgi:hypothetical protein
VSCKLGRKLRKLEWLVNKSIKLQKTNAVLSLRSFKKTSDFLIAEIDELFKSNFFIYS